VVVLDEDGGVFPLEEIDGVIDRGVGADVAHLLQASNPTPPPIVASLFAGDPVHTDLLGISPLIHPLG